MPDISVRFAGLDLSSPVIAGSAGITETVDRMRRCEENGAGAVVMKSYFEEEVSRDSPTPRFKVIKHDMGKDSTFTLFSYEQASEWDISRYAEEVRRAKDELTIKIIPSLNCITQSGWTKSAKMLEAAGADAIELNTSCPHGSITFRGGAVEETIFETVEAVRAAVKLPLIAKISPMLTSPISAAKHLEDTGVQAVTVFNRMTGLDIDVEEQKPVLHGGYGGHGGPWAIMYPLRWISEIRPQLKIDISGSGGVTSWEDVVKYILAGANTVQVVSAIVMNGFGVIREFADGLEKYMKEHGYERLDEFRGKAIGQIRGTHDVDRQKRYRAEITQGCRAPCTFACPADVPAMAYVNLTRERRFAEALDLLRGATPFQSICGRVCYHPCESNCVRQRLDEPIAIREIKRFLTEWGRKNAPLSEYDPPKQPATGKRVAVIGAGPAGLTAAYDLVLGGHDVEVFEATDRPGGLMVWGIPEFRLPRDLLSEELDFIQRVGVKINTGTALGRDFSVKQLKIRGFNAILVAIGAGKSIRLGVPGEDLPGVLTGLEFLKRVNAGERPKLGPRVAVIGGGNAAIDSARTALRLGVREVFIIYRRTRDEMPVQPEELEEAEAEGIKLLYLTAPVEIRSRGRVQEIVLRTGYLAEPGPDGRRRPEQLKETDFALRVDNVISALGQEVDGAALGTLLGPSGELQVWTQNLATDTEGIFAAGDVTRRAGTLIDAVAQGKQAARAIDRYLRTGAIPEDVSLERKSVDEKGVLANHIADPEQKRARTSREKVRRSLDFSEEHETYTEDEAVGEASRCLTCGCGVGCGLCERVCIYSAISADNGYYWIDPDKCDGCGLCAQRCPNANIQMVPVNSGSDNSKGGAQ